MPQLDLTTNGRANGLPAGATAFAGPLDPTEEVDGEPTAELAPPEEAVAAGSAVAVGRVFADRYLVEGRLGEGGTATILKARDLHGDAPPVEGGRIAIKTLKPELRFRAPSIARLQREFRQTQLLGHPNVVRQFGIGCDKGSWYIAMEMLDGEPLGRRLRDQRPNGLPMTEALEIAAACGDVLACAHEKGVTHGDVKPDNVFVTADQGIRVLDFGAAPSPEDASALPAAAALVTPAATRSYASPEVLAGLKPEPRDDVFSLACVIYEMLAGRHPYSRLGADEARDIGVRIEPVPGLSHEQWRALSAGLAWVRDARPGDVRELLDGLAPAGLPAISPPPAPLLAPAPLPASAPLPSPAPLTAQPPQPPRGTRQRFRPILALGALITTMGVFAILGDGRLNTPPAEPSAPAPAARVQPAPPAAASAAEATPVPAPTTVPAPPARRVAFRDDAMTVSRGTVAAAVPIRLAPGTTRARVSWRTIDGSAVAGRDYGGPRSGVAQFQEGQTDRIVYVPIVNDAAATADRSFTVELTGSPTGARLGSPRRIVVTIPGE